MLGGICFTSDGNFTIILHRLVTGGVSHSVRELHCTADPRTAAAQSVEADKTAPTNVHSRAQESGHYTEEGNIETRAFAS